MFKILIYIIFTVTYNVKLTGSKFYTKASQFYWVFFTYSNIATKVKLQTSVAKLWICYLVKWEACFSCKLFISKHTASVFGCHWLDDKNHIRYYVKVILLH